MAISSPRGGGNRRHAGLASEVRVGGKALGTGGAADQRRRCQRAATLLGEERRAMRLDECVQLALERVDLMRQRADMAQLLARHARPCIAPEGAQPPRYALLHHLASEAPMGQLGLELGTKLEQMPAQTVLDPGALTHEV